MNFTWVCILLLLIISGMFIELFTKCNGKVMAIAIIFFYVLIVSARAVDVVPDTEVYVAVYETLEISSFDGGSFNLGFLLLMKICQKLGLPYSVFFGVIAVLNYIIVYAGCRMLTENTEKTIIDGFYEKKKKPYYCLFSAIYLPYFGFFYNCIVLRQGIAMSLLILAFAFLMREKYIHYVIIVIVAILFHSSAVIGFSFLLFKGGYKHMSSLRYLAWWMGILFFWLSHLGLLFMKILPAVTRFIYKITGLSAFEHYERFTQDIRNAFWGKKELFFLLLGFIYAVAFYKKKNEKLLFPFFVGISLAFLVEYMMISYRIVDYFLLFYVPLGFVYMMNRKATWVNYMGVSCCCLIQMVISGNVIGYYR
ncbi:MAG: EpsG family protein [Butyrivibrio sp.]|nr:EpsG family protein [Butyrivibrio sp.]